MGRRAVALVSVLAAVIAVGCTPPPEVPPGPAVPTCFTSTGQYQVDFLYDAYNQRDNMKALTSGDNTCSGDVLNTFTYVIADNEADATTRCRALGFGFGFGGVDGVLTPDPGPVLYQCGGSLPPPGYED
jgi:hypothetical protein